MLNKTMLKKKKFLLFQIPKALGSEGGDKISESMKRLDDLSRKASSLMKVRQDN